MNEEDKKAPAESAEPPPEAARPAAERARVAVDESQAAVELTRADPGTQPKKRAAGRSKSKAKPKVNSVEDLLRFAYESKARLLELSSESLRALPISDEGIDAQGTLISSLARTDPTLATPFKLLQYIAYQGVRLRSSGDGDVKRVLERLVGLSIVAMSTNPVFTDWADQLRDPQREPQLSTKHVRHEASKIDAHKLGLAADEFKAADSDRLVNNAVACYSLLRIVQGEWSLDRYIDESYESAWEYEAPRGAGVERAASTLAGIRELDGLGIVAANYTARIIRLERQIAQLEGEASAAANREVRLTEELRAATDREQAATARAEAFSADIVRLQKELAAERDNRAVDKSHMADDYETLRTRIIRRLSNEIDLLTDGLHALRNDAPSVADEFLDRSLLALTREIEQLKEADGGLA